MDSNFRFRTREATDLSFRFLSMSRNCPRSSAENHLARGRRFKIPGPAGPMGRTPDHWKTPSPRPNGLMARPGTESSNPSPSSGGSATNCTGDGLRWSPANFTVRQVSADAVYNTKQNQEEIAAIGAEAFIP